MTEKQPEGSDQNLDPTPFSDPSQFSGTEGPTEADTVSEHQEQTNPNLNYVVNDPNAPEEAPQPVQPEPEPVQPEPPVQPTQDTEPGGMAVNQTSTDQAEPLDHAEEVRQATEDVSQFLIDYDDQTDQAGSAADPTPWWEQPSSEAEAKIEQPTEQWDGTKWVPGQDMEPQDTEAGGMVMDPTGTDQTEPLEHAEETGLSQESQEHLPPEPEGPPLPNLADLLDQNSPVLEELSARQLLEVQQVLKDPSSLSDPAVLEDLNPHQMQAVVQAFLGHLNASSESSPTANDGDGDGIAGEYGDGPDLDENGVPDEIGINPDILQPDYPDSSGTGQTEPLDSEPPTSLPNLADLLDPNSPVLEELSARELLEVQDVLKDPSSLSDPAVLEDLNPHQMQAVMQAFVGHLNASSDSGLTETTLDPSVDPSPSEPEDGTVHDEGAGLDQFLLADPGGVSYPVDDLSEATDSYFADFASGTGSAFESEANLSEAAPSGEASEGTGVSPQGVSPWGYRYDEETGEYSTEEMWDGIEEVPWMTLVALTGTDVVAEGDVDDTGEGILGAAAGGFAFGGPIGAVAGAFLGGEGILEYAAGEAGEAIGDVWDWGSGIAEDPEDAAEDVGDAFVDAAEAVGGAVEDVGEAFGGAAEDVGDFFSDLF